MGQFGIETRKWLVSVIKQRKLLLKLNKSHKSQLEVELAIEVLDDLLGTYSYENDLYMARFIQQNLRSIEAIIPGKGSTSHIKRNNELTDINKRAIQIMMGAAAFQSHRLTTKTTQYEMEF